MTLNNILNKFRKKNEFEKISLERKKIEDKYKKKSKTRIHILMVLTVLLDFCIWWSIWYEFHTFMPNLKINLSIVILILIFSSFSLLFSLSKGFSLSSIVFYFLDKNLKKENLEKSIFKYLSNEYGILKKEEIKEIKNYLETLNEEEKNYFLEKKDIEKEAKKSFENYIRKCEPSEIKKNEKEIVEAISLLFKSKVEKEIILKILEEKLSIKEVDKRIEDLFKDSKIENKKIRQI